MISRRSLIAKLVFVCCLLASTSTAMAAGQGATGTFTTPVRTGPAKFVAVKRVVQLNGFQGTMSIGGRNYPGVMYGFRDGTGRIGMVWYYPNDYAQAGQAVLSLQPDGSYAGPLDFTNHRGAVTESGTLNMKVTF